MNHKNIFSDARWLSPQEDLDAALFRSEFDICEKANRAEITICGLGYFILYINGSRVGKDEFVPAYSDYHDRTEMSLVYPLNDTRSFRIYCLKYDITPYLKAGKNVIGIAVGGGFYHQLLRKAEGSLSYGKIKVCYKIDLDGREILSNKNDVDYSDGFFRKSNLFFGETLDFTGFDRSWNTVGGKLCGSKTPLEVSPPKSEYFIQDCPADTVAEVLKPELVKNFGDYSVYKIEKNISGYPVIRCDKAGEKVVMECTENLNDDLTLNDRSIGFGEQKQIEVITTDDSKIFHPYFCWFGFRYFSLTNNAEPVEVRFIHSDVKVTSDFECSDKTLNWYYKTFINTQLSNMHGGVPSDCPHRERLGYTGDGQLTCNAVITEFDAKDFYRKWIRDIADCQDIATGHVQHTAPFAGGGGGPAGWGGAIINVSYFFYRHYGDKAELANMFDKMDKFVGYMESRCENGLVTREEKDGWCLGDWCTPQKIEIPEDFVNTTMYISQLRRMVYCAEVLGKDSEKYRKLIDEHSKAIVEKYFDEKSGNFIADIQGANSFAYDCGLGNEATLKNIVKKYTENTRFDTGIFGTEILLRTLYSSGSGDLATELLANKNDISFESMRQAGATTLWENWNGEASHSHPMFGASTEFLFEEILGIKQAENSVCYDETIISPTFARCLDFAKGKITTPHGVISVSWARDGEKIRVNIELCDGIRAIFKNNGQIFPLHLGSNELVF